MSKKENNNEIRLLGKASEDVTGSQYLVRFGETQCLLECGLFQSSNNNYLTSYKANTANFGFVPSKIDYVIVNHAHVDHSGLIPRLVKEGFHGRIITTRKTAEIMKLLLLNSAHILAEEARVLSRRSKRTYNPPYDIDDVYRTFKLIDTYDEYNQVYKLNENVSFQWLKNSHCIGAAQVQLILRDGNNTRKILYTSDLGMVDPENHYVPKTQIPDLFNDIVLMESTKGADRHVVTKSRNSEIKKIRKMCNDTLQKGGNIVFPAFSFSRTQEILTVLYSIFGSNDSFIAPVIVDSPLSCEVSKAYSKLLTGDYYELWEQVCNWKNVRFISDKEESIECVHDKTPKIIISSSGFCTNGRVVDYLMNNIANKYSTIIFTGYVGDNPSYPSYRLMQSKNGKSIKINGEIVEVRANLVFLSSFSSHPDYNGLVKFGSSLNTNKLILVHGTEESKSCLAQGLTEAISKNNKCYKVIPSKRGMIVNL